MNSSRHGGEGRQGVGHRRLTDTHLADDCLEPRRTNDSCDGDRLVAVTDYCDYPPEATRKPRVGGISTPSFEAILALRSDLVIATSESNYAEHVEQ